MRPRSGMLGSVFYFYLERRGPRPITAEPSLSLFRRTRPVCATIVVLRAHRFSIRAIYTISGCGLAAAPPRVTSGPRRRKDAEPRCRFGLVRLLSCRWIKASLSAAGPISIAITRCDMLAIRERDHERRDLARTHLVEADGSASGSSIPPMRNAATSTPKSARIDLRRVRGGSFSASFAEATRNAM